MTVDIAQITREWSALRPAGGFDVILNDPPTEFETWSEAGEEKAPQAQYDTMTLDEIASLPGELLAARDCAMFLWMTWPLMPHWMRIIRAFGFEFAGLAWEWIKYNPETGNYAFGPGYGTRKNLEPCLLCTRGDPGLRKALGGSLFGSIKIPEGVHSVRDFIQAMPLDAIRAPRREHSRKPDEQYARIETLFGGRKVELFARTRRDGWTSWGRELGKFA